MRFSVDLSYVDVQAGKSQMNHERRKLFVNFFKQRHKLEHRDKNHHDDAALNLIDFLSAAMDFSSL